MAGGLRLGQLLVALVVSGAALGLGYLIADLALGKRLPGRAVRWGLALPGFAVFVLALMVLHMVSGGRVLSNAWLTRLVTLGGALLLWRAARRRRDGDREPWRDLLVPAALVGLGLLVWGTPVARMLPLDHGGDTNLHTGWAAQLLAGETTPSGAITGPIPNFYPWLFHAVLAFIARFTPGGTPFHALGPLQLLFVGGSMLSLYALGRQLLDRRTAGAGAALFAGAAGGVGFVLLRGLDVVLEPRAEGGLAGVRYLGDLLFKRSYNASFANLAPPFPRDLAFALLVGFLLLLVAGLRRRSLPLLAGGGVVLGMAGLGGAEALFAGAGTAILACLLPGQDRRLRTLAAVLVPAGAIYALWAVPMLLSYLRLGFVSITIVGPVLLPKLAILASWGVVVPFAAWGAWRWVPRARTDPGARVLLALVVVTTGILLASAAVPGALGKAFESLGRRHRYWPLLHFGVALYGALGLAELLRSARRRSPRLAVGIVVATVAIAVASPTVASLALPRAIGRPQELGLALDGDPASALRVLMPRPGLRCVAAVPTDRSIRVFSYTGYRLVMYVWSEGYQTNKARLRWRRIYEEIPGDAERLRDNDVLTNARGDASAWRAAARKYGVDLVVIPAALAASPAVAGYPVTLARLGDAPVAVVHVGTCGGGYPATRPV